jgi:Peptidase family C78
MLTHVTHVFNTSLSCKERVRTYTVNGYSNVLTDFSFFLLGGFCGYRNIQMMASYINGAKSQGFYHFDGKLPTIFQIQEFIEHAWDLGINAQGRSETGGIRGTRKYIGTPEVSEPKLASVKSWAEKC